MATRKILNKVTPQERNTTVMSVEEPSTEEVDESPNV